MRSMLVLVNRKNQRTFREIQRPSCARECLEAHVRRKTRAQMVANQSVCETQKVMRASQMLDLDV
jgi:hypothetical protein